MFHSPPTSKFVPISAKQPCLLLAVGSNSRRNTCLKCSGWRSKSQGLARSLVQEQRELVELRLAEHRDVCTLWHVLPQEPIGVFVRPALPGALGVAEIDLDVGRDGEALVVRHLVTPIPGERTLKGGGELLDGPA